MGLTLGLFAGPGGWDEALRALGVTDVVGIEWDADACRTRTAAGHRTIRADVSQYPTEPFIGKVSGLIASPPCPTFSAAGNGLGRDELPELIRAARAIAAEGWCDPWKLHRWADPRTPLVLEPLRWVVDLSPRWVACEQVPAVLPLWAVYADIWRKAGYSAWAGVLDAECFGVPQTRDRAVLMATLDGPCHPPEPTHQRYVPGEPQWSVPQGDLFGSVRLPWVSMAEALGWGAGSPCVTITGGGGATGGPDPICHGARFREREIVGLRRVRGEGMTERHGERQDRPVTEPAHTITSKGRSDVWVVDRRTNSKAAGGGMTATVPVPMDRPAPTMTGKSGHQWVFTSPATTITGDPRITHRGHHEHGEQLRGAKTTEQIRGGDYDGTEPVKLTIAEGLILQSFRVDYPVQGTRTSQWTQIGNAIPPLLARVVLAQLLSAIRPSNTPERTAAHE